MQKKFNYSVPGWLLPQGAFELVNALFPDNLEIKNSRVSAKTIRNLALNFISELCYRAGTYRFKKDKHFIIYSGSDKWVEIRKEKMKKLLGQKTYKPIKDKLIKARLVAYHPYTDKYNQNRKPFWDKKHHATLYRLGRVFYDVQGELLPLELVPFPLPRIKKTHRRSERHSNEYIKVDMRDTGIASTEKRIRNHIHHLEVCLSQHSFEALCEHHLSVRPNPGNAISQDYIALQNIQADNIYTYSDDFGQRIYSLFTSCTSDMVTQLNVNGEPLYAVDFKASHPTLLLRLSHDMRFRVWLEQEFKVDFRCGKTNRKHIESIIKSDGGVYQVFVDLWNQDVKHKIVVNKKKAKSMVPRGFFSKARGERKTLRAMMGIQELPSVSLLHRTEKDKRINSPLSWLLNKLEKYIMISCWESVYDHPDFDTSSPLIPKHDALLSHERHLPLIEQQMKVVYKEIVGELPLVNIEKSTPTINTYTLPSKTPTDSQAVK